MPGTLQATRVNEADLTLYRLLEPEAMADPYPLYQRIRDHERVHWDPFMHSWVVTGYAEAVIALAKYRAGRTPTPEHLNAMGLSALGPYAELMLRQMLFTDAPVHTRLRSLCGAAFTSARIERLRGEAQAIAEGLIERRAGKGTMDVVKDFAGPLPSTVLCSMMGLPVDDRAQVKAWCNDLGELLGNFEHDPSRIARVMTSLVDMQRYLTERVAEQRRVPGHGVLSVLIEAEMDGSRLTDVEVVANAMLMLAGGLEETANLIGNSVLSLIERPEALAQMRDRPEMVPSAVEELLRFSSPTQHTGRMTPEAVELGGKRLPAGASVTVVLGAANRDPTRFADPDCLHLGRKENRHVAFGYASHYCLGAPLTRLIAQVAIPALLRRLPGLALAEGDAPVWRPLTSLRGLASLPVRFQCTGAHAKWASG